MAKCNRYNHICIFQPNRDLHNSILRNRPIDCAVRFAHVNATGQDSIEFCIQRDFLGKFISILICCLIRAESQGAVSGTVVAPLSLCLGNKTAPKPSAPSTLLGFYSANLLIRILWRPLTLLLPMKTITYTSST